MNPAQQLARKAHAWWCQRHNLRPLACAYADCQWPGLWRRVVTLPGEDGTWRYVFCRKAHRQAWATENGLRL